MFLDARQEVSSTKPLVRRSDVIAQQTRNGRSPDLLSSRVLLQFLPSGVCFVVALETPLILGRDPAAGSRFLDLTDLNAHRHGVSRYHCTLERENDHLVVMDLKSTNGTFLNGRRLRPQHKVPVADGDHLVLGTLHALVFLHSPNELP